MAALRANSRFQVGSSTWISEERNAALQIADAEVEEFTFSARNEFDWLNEHMAEIFNENQINVAEIFKTPGKLRGKTPRTARKRNPLESRAPLSDIFSASPKATPSPSRLIDIPRQASKFQVAEDKPEPSKIIDPVPKSFASRAVDTINFDSGYHGSQASVVTEADEIQRSQYGNKTSPAKAIAQLEQMVKDNSELDERRTTEGSYRSAKEEQTNTVSLEDSFAKPAVSVAPASKQQQRTIQSLRSPAQTRVLRSPAPARNSPLRPVPPIQKEEIAVQPKEEPEADIAIPQEEPHSSSDASSPIAPIVRKSSMNFASLPAREPLTATKKSVGNRISRASHFGKQGATKSLSNATQGGEGDEMDIDSEDGPRIENENSDADSKAKQMHNKTYTQRLQDQISKLGQSQANGPRPSKSIPNIAALAQPTYPVLPPEPRQQPSPARTEHARLAPGAFPEDDDDWIGPPTVPTGAPSIFSPRGMLTKSYSTDVMEGIHGIDNVGGSEFKIPKTRVLSPVRDRTEEEPGLGLTKSISAPVIDSPRKVNEYDLGLTKAISVSNPNAGSAVDNVSSTTPAKSPSRSYRESPLKAAKDKLSSILKTSKGLFASSAAASAGAMAAISPAPSRVGHNIASSLEDLSQPQRFDAQPLYPSISTQIDDQMITQMDSPSKNPSLRKAKEREAKEAKEAQLMAEQLNKLDREREKEAEKARIFSQQERERVAAMERQIAAQEKEKLASISQAPPPKATRTSPRKNKAQLEAEGRAAASASLAPANPSIDEQGNIEMTDASSQPSRPLTGSQPAKPREQIKRPMKPTKEPLSRPKQAPVVIRVNTGSRPFQPSNAALAASLQDSLAPPARPSTASAMGPTSAPKPKVGSRPLHTKPSTDSVRSFASSTTATGKVKALEAAARKKEQDEREAQRKREAKIELANQLDAKKNAQRALEKKQQLEKAKLERPPPPAVRPTPSNEVDHAGAQEKQQRPDLSQNKPLHRMNSAMLRQEEPRPGPSSHNTTKALPKRPLPGDEQVSRPTLLRNGPSYQQNEHKRRKTGEEQDGEAVDAQSRGPLAPPIRQSTIRQKDGPTKSLFPSGYANAPQPAHAPVHKAAHPMHPSKPTHPMDMVQNSKAPINFAPNPSHSAAASHKTPARPAGPGNVGGKSTTKKSSPRYQNGENIELPEIHTDSEDDDSDAGNDFAVPDWADSPNLNMNLMAQEGQDPAIIFGPPGELRMEDVFKNKERWNRFRARTSSANWTGNDRLTEEEIQRDLLARERLRREGGWSYGMSFGQ